VEDNQIVELFWARAEAAVAEAAHQYGGYCKRIAFNILANEQDAEECVNDTYLQAWKSIPPQKPQYLGAFLGKITRNAALNRYKRERAQKRGGGELALIFDELADCIPAVQTVEKEVEAAFLEKKINAFLHTLSDEQLAVFVKRYWGADSVATISGQIGISESKTKSILFRVRKKLKLYLEREGIFL